MKDSYAVVLSSFTHAPRRAAGGLGAENTRRRFTSGVSSARTRVRPYYFLISGLARGLYPLGSVPVRRDITPPARRVSRFSPDFGPRKRISRPSAPARGRAFRAGPSGPRGAARLGIYIFFLH